MQAFGGTGDVSDVGASIVLRVLEGDLPGFEPVYFNPNGIANILSLAAVEAARRRVTYDSWDGQVFHVHNPDTGKIVDFHQLPSGLYVYDTSQPKQEKHKGVSLVETVQENKTVILCQTICQSKTG